MMSQMPLNYQRSCFTWRNCGCTPSVYVCSLLASFPFGGVVRSHAKAERKGDTSVMGREREEEFSSSHYIDLPNFC